MAFTYETQGTNTYLVYKISAEDTIDSMSLGMLTNNRIEALAPTTFMQIDEDKFLKYNVSARVTASQMFSSTMNCKRLTGIFSGITNALLSAEEYMIDPDSIVLDMDYVFADVSTCDTFLICLPIIPEEAKKVDYGTMFKSILFQCQFDPLENGDYITKILNYLNGAPQIVLSDFKQLIDSLRKEERKPAQFAQLPPKEVRREPVPKAKPAVSAPAAPPVSQPKPQFHQPVTSTPPQDQGVPQPFSKPTAPSIQIPGQTPSQTPSSEEKPEIPSTDQKPISLFYLLQHYNSENAAAYKAQKELKKQKKEDGGKKKKSKEQPAAPSIPQIPSIPNSPQIPQPERPAVSPQIPQTPQVPQFQQPVRPQSVPQFQQPVSSVSQPYFSAPYEGDLNEGTVVLDENAGQEKSKAPHLIRIRTQEVVPINKPMFRIGKEQSYVDYYIGDNSAVSRSHLNVVTRGDEYFVMDTNSTNHTYINGVMIPSGTEIQIHHGDKICLANEDFEFKEF